MNELFIYHEDDEGFLTIEFINKNVVLCEDSKYFDDPFFSRIFGRDLILKGRGPVELYTYAAYWCVKKGCRSIRVYDFNSSRTFLVYDRNTAPEKSIPIWCNFKTGKEADELRIMPSQQADARWSEEDIQKYCYCFELPQSANVLMLTGKGNMVFYSCLGCSAALSAFSGTYVDKPTEKTYIRIDGNFFGKKDGKPGYMIGILGDPNSGKSVFSHTLGCILQKYSKSDDVWVYDCDAAAPTSDWYIYGLQTANTEEAQQFVKEVREKIKQKWTPELQQQVADNMQKVKENLNLVIADLPGGKHDDEKNIHQRIAGADRARMIAVCNEYVIIARKDRPEVVQAWKKALAEYGLDSRVSAVVISSLPEQSPSATEAGFDNEQVFHVELTGLDRRNSRNDLVEVLSSSFQEYAAHLFTKLNF